jgi:hypothetical protein
MRHLNPAILVRIFSILVLGCASACAARNIPTEPSSAQGVQAPAFTQPPALRLAPTSTQPLALGLVPTFTQPPLFPITGVTPQPALGGSSSLATPSSGVVDLPEMLDFFMGGGGPPGLCMAEDKPVPYANLYSKLWPQAQIYYLCIWGLPAGQVAQVSLANSRTKAGLGTASYTVGDPGIDTSVFMKQKTTLLMLPLNIPLAMNLTDLDVSVTVNNQAVLNTALHVADPTDCSAQNINPQTITHSLKPLQRALLPIDPRYLAPYRKGDQLNIQGVCLPPSQDLWVGIYSGYNGHLELKEKLLVRTDASGSFNQDITIDQKYNVDEFYSVIAPGMIKRYESNQFGLDGEDGVFSVQNGSITHFSASPDSHLRIGERVTVAPGPRNNVRLGFCTDPGCVIGHFSPGEPILLLDGPVEGGFIFWLGVSEKTGLIGLTAEGDANEKWLVPLTSP